MPPAPPMGFICDKAGEPGMKRERLGCPAPAFPAAISGEADGCMAAGAEDQGIWLVGALSVEVSGGCPGTRLGGNPMFEAGDCMPTPGISPSMETGGQDGGACCAAIGGGDHCCTGTAAGAGMGEVTVCPQLGHGPETPAI
jgi:hypothetical protein